MFSLIFIIVLIIYLILNYFFISSLFKIFSYKNKKIFIYLFLFFTLFPILSIFLHVLTTDILWKFIYMIGISYIWIIIISSYVFVPYRVINLKYKSRYTWYISLFLCIFILIFSFYSSRNITIKQINISSNKIEENIKIAYMSDIHIDSINDDKYIDKIVKIVNWLWVDIVLINWDLIDWTSLKHSTLTWFNKINPPIYATLWNHEIYTGVEYVNELLSTTKIILLQDDVINVSWINILLSDELWTRGEEINLTSLDTFIKENISEKDFNIIMIHEPIWTEITKKYSIDLQLAWHTHNWQIWPFSYIVKNIYGYNYWLYELWNMKLYISSWAWTWWPPFRLGTKNEIVVINLEKQKN